MLEIRHASGDTRLAYNAIYRKRGIQQMDSLYLWILRLLKPEPGRRLLDVACGQGTLVYLAARQGLYAYGMDLSDVAIRSARNQEPSGALSVSDGQALPYREATFDYVTNVGSLEHYADMAAGVREMARVLRPTGRACILVPNSFGLRWNVAYVWRTGDICDDGQPIQRYATRRQWERLLEENGLRVERTLGYEQEGAFPRTWSDLVFYLRSGRRLLKWLWARILPVNMASMFVFVCRKAQPGEVAIALR